MKIGIVGAGAIGLTLGAALAKAHDVLVLAHRPATAELLAREGIAVTGETEVKHVRVHATAEPARFADREAVLVAVKAYATTEALVPLRGVLPPHALVASVQNGIDNAALARAALPENRVIAGSTMQGAISLGEGRVRVVNRGETTFARDDHALPTSFDLAHAFVAAGLGARVADDVEAVLWRKLIVNAALNPLGALAARTNGAVATDPDLAPLAQILAAEAADVAAAEGIDVGDPWETVEAAARASAANRNSMLQDLDAGRPTEIDAISGALLRRAREHGIAVPLTETVLRLVRGRERSALKAGRGDQP